MPKITEQKKPVKKVQPKQEELKPAEIKAESKVVVFRLFECVVHLEIALKHLNQVGIFPGPENEALELKRLMSHAISNTNQLCNKYKAVWGAMPKS